MSTRGNSLKAALVNAAAADAEVKPKPKAAIKKQTVGRKGRAVTTPKPKAQTEASKPRYRDTTVLVGGHFPPNVQRQLRMIAAEEGTTNQALLAEALDLLFTRKGKEKISDLTAG